ncbi:MAG TPA: hypothetical protein DDX98_00045, partial [Bacteroidales bacterium]|nr:hypothetical protein [Bacteroidales bacterium]
EERLCLDKESDYLRTEKGAEIKIDSIRNNVLQLSVLNLNGKRTSKYELFELVYRMYSKRIPKNYRLIVKV